MRTHFVVLGLAGVRWRWRKVTAIFLALLLDSLAFESSLHSVHHLSNPEEAAQCQVLAVSQYLSGVGAERPAVGTQLPAVEAPAPARTEQSLQTLVRPDMGRAPPSVLG